MERSYTYRNQWESNQRKCFDENWNQELDIDNCGRNSNIKRPPSAFLLFTSDFRPKYQNLYPNKSNIELSQLLGHKWKELSDFEKEPYKKRAEQLLSDFKAKNPQYNYKKAKKKRILSQIRGVLSENPLLEAQLVSGQFGSDTFQYPLDPEAFFLFTIGNRYLDRALRGKCNESEYMSPLDNPK